MNGNESGQKLDSQEMAGRSGQVGAAGNVAVGAGMQEMAGVAGGASAGLGREQAGVIGSAALAGGRVAIGSAMLTGEQVEDSNNTLAGGAGENWSNASGREVPMNSSNVPAEGLGDAMMGGLGSELVGPGDGLAGERDYNAERVEQIVAAENRLGEKQRLAEASSAAPVTPEALIMPEVQAKVDKAMVQALGQLTNAEGGHPGRLEGKLNEMRRRYIESWRTQ